MPGVQTLISTAIPGSSGTVPVNATYFSVGLCERGPINTPVPLLSMGDYANIFGGPTTYGASYLDLTAHFNEGGVKAQLIRVVGPAATTGTLSLADSSAIAGALTAALTTAGPITALPVAALAATVAAGTVTVASGVNTQTFTTTGAAAGATSLPVTSATPTYAFPVGSVVTLNSVTPPATLTVNAASPGAWSANLTAEIDPGPIPNTFNLVLAYQGQIVESYQALQSPADAVAKVNAISNFVSLAVVPDATVAPANNPAPRAAAALSAGSDDRGNATATVMVAALAGFPAALGSGVVAIPGQPAALVAAGIQAHCAANSRIGFTVPPVGQTVPAVQSLVKTVIGATGGRYVGMMWPWVTAPNGSGGTTTISPEGAIAGLRAKVQAAIGPWQPPAGGNGVFRWVTGTELAVASSDANSLDAAGVSVIRIVAGGPRLYGWRSLSSDLVNYPLLKDQDTINFIVAQCDAALEQVVFSVIDGNQQLFGRMAGLVKGVLEPIRLAGGLYPADDTAGNVIDLGYTIDTSAAVNTPQSLANNVAQVAVGVRISPAAGTVQFTLTKAAITAAP